MIAGVFVNSTDAEARRAIEALLRHRGPTTEETIRAYFHLRARIVLDTSLAELIESGEVEADWPDGSEEPAFRKSPRD